MNELKSESVIFNQLMNKVMSDLNVFGSRMLNKIFRDVNGTGTITIYSEIFLTNTITRCFCIQTRWVQQLLAMMYSTSAIERERKRERERERWNSASYSSMRQNYCLNKNIHRRCFYTHQHSLLSPHQNI